MAKVTQKYTNTIPKESQKYAQWAHEAHGANEAHVAHAAHGAHVAYAPCGHIQNISKHAREMCPPVLK